MNRDGTQDFSKPICQPRNDVRSCVNIVVVGSAVRAEKPKPPEKEEKKEEIARPNHIVF